ncbi:methyl-accepting chemotaxis protein [Alkalihalobacillus sp. BA299]|uniref:methyl-accepting chemotaxis protein n=1 Tax=Alkalihalobacillus sp. BA299 TaxID=2815938 RepID=UPI001ADB8003|nr:methyl-accepting chemotaxis protein [Alkalihalobacillus sp. BA299]
MKDKKLSLRKQFLKRMFSILIVIALFSGGLQLYLMNQEINRNVENQATLIAQTIQQGISETEEATKEIEHQLNLKMIGYSKHIAELLKGYTIDEITNEKLIEIRDQFELAGLTIFARTEDGSNIVGVRATEPEEIGFSFKDFGHLQLHEDMLNGKEPYLEGAYTEENILALPIAQSGSHKDEPVFFKYVYYHPPGTNYIIDPYIEANEVYQFTKKVGTDAWIDKIYDQNPYVEEIAVLNPLVFKDPSLEVKLYPPKKKVEFGDYEYKDERDTKELLSMIEEPKQINYVHKVKDKKIYKMFLPVNDERVIYIALDYEMMSGPLYSFSIILIVSGLGSLLVLFFLTARFFNRIYENIQKIIDQIKLLESGDLTTKSEIKDSNELENLSQSTNRMVDKLNKLVKDTQEQATKTQRLSVILEAEASHSVEKMYEVSTETTIKSREQLLEITTFLDELEEVLQQYKENNNVFSVIEKVEVMRQLTNEQTAATTEMTITLSDLLKSLHDQSSELSDISNTLIEQMNEFKL